MNRTLVPRRVDRAELLDLGRGSRAEVRRSLRDIERINNSLGGTRLVVGETLRLLQRQGLRSATVLDIGTGSADIPRRLCGAGARAGVELRVMAVDNNRRHLQIAQEGLNDGERLHLVQADGFWLPLRDAGVDVVISSLFLHHFAPDQTAALLREFHRVARCGFVMTDIVRHTVPLAFFRLARPVLARSYLTRYDAQVSLRRAYTIEEMTAIVNEAKLPHAGVRQHFPYRMSITVEKPLGG